MSKFLQQVTKGKTRGAYKIVLYGTEGVGKSTFASEAPSPIFMDTEGGTEELDLQRLPKIDKFTDILAALDELTVESHEYKTFVLDTADWAESLIWKHVCELAGVASIEDVGYGKGFTAALDHWRTLLARLDALRNKRQMNVIVLAHAHIRTFRNPAGEDYETYELKLNNKAAGILKEWPYALLFARYQTFTHTDKQKRTRGVGDGSRVLITEARPAWAAKNRYGLPFEMPLSWHEFDAAARSGAPVTANEAGDAIAELMLLASEEVKVQAEGALQRAAGDPVKLAKLVDWLRGKVSKAA